MLQLDRKLGPQISECIKADQLILLVGAHGVGKTSLIHQVFENFEGKSLCLNAEEAVVRQVLEKKTSKLLKRFLGDVKLLAIDEAQIIPDIQEIVKLIFQEIKGICIILTSGSSLMIGPKYQKAMKEALHIFKIFAYSQEEISRSRNAPAGMHNLEERLILGNYPGQLELETIDEKIAYQKQFTDTYLLKELFEKDGFRGTTRMAYILQLLALQIGQEISSYELGKDLGMSRNTADKYLNYLREAFIIFKLPSFNRSHSRELSKTNRWYFYDNGVRNAMINNFSPFNMRFDKSQLWENYCIAERMKMHLMGPENVEMYFWKTYEKQELTLIEERKGQLHAFDIRWEKEGVKVPKHWKESYPQSEFRSLSRHDYPDCLLE